jgi:hypothetical protein
MLYNNTASINYLEFNRLNPSSSTITINASITASLVSASDYQGSTQFMDFLTSPIATFNTNVLAPTNTSENVLRTVEIPNNLIPKDPGIITQFTYTRLEQQVSSTNGKTWRLYVNSTGSLTGASLINTGIRTTNAQSFFSQPNFFISASTLFYVDNTVAWNASNKVTLPYDTISSSIWLISTVQKVLGSEGVREHYAYVDVSKTQTIIGEPTPL